MAKKRATRKPSGANDNINDFLERREARKYGPRVVSNEAQYSQGEMSKALRAKMAADRAVRSQFSTTPKPPVQGPAAPGQYQTEYMDKGKWYRSLSGKSVPERRADILRGRTVEYGTRSMLQGLRSWITGGGGSRLSGR